MNKNAKKCTLMHTLKIPYVLRIYSILFKIKNKKQSYQ